MEITPRIRNMFNTARKAGWILLLMSLICLTIVAIGYFLKGQWIGGIPYIVLFLVIGYIAWSISRIK